MIPLGIHWVPFVNNVCGNLEQVLCEKSCSHETGGDGNNWKQSQGESRTSLRGCSDPWNCLLVPVEQSLLALTLLCLFRYKPTGEVGAFYENPARLRAHGVQRCLHLPYVPRCCCCFLHPARPGCCMECALAWSKGLGMTLGQQGGATSCGWCVLEERCDPAG